MLLLLFCCCFVRLFFIFVVVVVVVVVVCHVDIDVSIYRTCGFFDCQLDFDVDNMLRSELANFYGV